MGNLNVADMICARSLGCLDPEEDLAFTKMMKDDENFPWDELGQYQNLVALLPTLLEVEQPEKEIKDSVARKLYELEKKRQEKQKIKGTPPQTVQTKTDEPISRENLTVDGLKENNEKEPLSDLGVVIEEERVKGEISFKDHGMPVIPMENQTITKTITESDKPAEPRVTKNFKPSLKEKESPKVKSYVSKHSPEPEIQTPKEKSSKTLAVILFVIALLLIIAAYFKLSSDIEKNKRELEMLKNRIGSSLMILPDKRLTLPSEEIS